MTLEELIYWPNGIAMARYLREINSAAASGNERLIEKLSSHLDWCQAEVPMYSGIPKKGDAFSRLNVVSPFDKSRTPYPVNETRSQSRFNGERIDGTSGTSGLSFRFLTTRNERAVRKSYEYLANMLLGLSPGEKHIVVWGGHESAESFVKSIKVWVVDKISGRLLTVVSGADRQSLKRVETDIRENQGGVLITYPSMLVGLIEELSLIDVLSSYKRIILTGEALPEELFTKYGLANIKNRYGSREFGAIAVGDSLELAYFSERFVIESDPDLGLLITDLEKKCMPMLRYPIGDFLKTPHPSDVQNYVSVGEKSMRLLGQVEGRVFDILIGRSGKKYVGTFWTIVLKQLGVSKFRLVEVATFRLVLKFSGAVSTSSLADKLSAMIEEDFEIEFVKVDSIPELKNAKQKIIERKSI